MSNPRKGKTPKVIWLTIEEIKSIEESLKDTERYGQNIIDIVKTAKNRGDFICMG
jgi:hypothetical protein